MTRRLRTAGVHGLLVVLALALLLPQRAAAAALADALRTRIEGFVRERLSEAPASIWLPSLGDFDLPGVDAKSVRIELSAPARAGRAGALPVTIVLADGERVLKRGVVTARVRRDRSVWVAARNLRRAERIGREDLRAERRELGSLHDGVTGHLDSLVGMQTRRSISEGTPLRTQWVEAPALVVRGQLVRLVLHGPELRIEAVGRALSDGANGDAIRVLNADSRREVFGRVGPDGVVHVGF